jgi:hypothetical protein
LAIPSSITPKSLRKRQWHFSQFNAFDHTGYKLT